MGTYHCCIHFHLFCLNKQWFHFHQWSRQHRLTCICSIKSAPQKQILFHIKPVKTFQATTWCTTYHWTCSPFSYLLVEIACLSVQKDTRGLIYRTYWWSHTLLTTKHNEVTFLSWYLHQTTLKSNWSSSTHFTRQDSFKTCSISICQLACFQGNPSWAITNRKKHERV